MLVSPFASDRVLCYGSLREVDLVRLLLFAASIRLSSLVCATQDVSIRSVLKPDCHHLISSTVLLKLNRTFWYAISFARCWFYVSLFSRHVRVRLTFLPFRRIIQGRYG